MVTGAAAALMAATAANHVAISEQVLHDLNEHFALDFAALRHTEHEIRATRLVASWPPRSDVPDPDPIGLVYFAEADSVFALIESYTEPYVLRPEPANDDYQQTIEANTGIPQTSLAAVPGRVYSRLELLNRVRGYELASERVVDSHVKNLRRKIEADPRNPCLLLTVYGLGYKAASPP